MRWLILVAGIVALCAQARAQGHVKAQLIADATAIAAGKPFHLGVLLTVDPGWHVYWKNPGDSGLPTTVKFEAPAGFSVSELKYPIPTKFWQPGDIIGYGYTDSVLLVAEVAVPKDLAAGTEIAIKADVSYLVCEQVCIPGRASLSLELTVASEAQPANQESFATWLPRIPLEGAAAADVASVQTHGQAGSKVTIEIQWKQPAADVEFFPGRSTAMRIKDVTVQTRGKITTVAFTAEVLRGQKPEPTLDGVVAYSGRDGVRRALAVQIPMAGK